MSGSRLEEGWGALGSDPHSAMMMLLFEKCWVPEDFQEEIGLESRDHNLELMLEIWDTLPL